MNRGIPAKGHTPMSLRLAKPARSSRPAGRALFAPPGSRRTYLPLVLGIFLLSSACKNEAVSLQDVPGHDTIVQDNTHKEAPRLMAAESYMRSYLRIFGGLTSLQAQTQLTAGGDRLFDSFNNYLAALGLPSYAADLPRANQTNALMVATFERLGIALCDKALLKDWPAGMAVPIPQRLVYAFDPPADPTNKAAFAEGFDVLHRTFLGYPARLAPTSRIDTYFELFNRVRTGHTADPKQSKFTATQAAWAAMCYGLVRHPEFHLY